MAFTAARIKYKLQSGYGEGKYVIRNCIVGICSILSHQNAVFSGPAAQGAFLFCRRGENDDSAAVWRDERGGAEY